MHCLRALLTSIVLVVATLALGACDLDPPATASRDHARAGAGKAKAAAQESGGQRPTARQRAITPPRTHPRPRPEPRPVPRQRTYLVTRVVDGDTLELGNGQTVRLVGIDTPEIGECGHDRASVALGRLVTGRQVRLTMSDEDRDRYGRLLRYVDVGGVDGGLRQIRSGFAIARYDSRDGYGFHPREPRYIAADNAKRNISCPKPAAAPQPLVGGGGACAPGYSPCVPPYPPDVDCADVNGPITVTGSDPHGLDADGDGVACE
jgi:endonuclease YncB( thermonuclease family)